MVPTICVELLRTVDSALRKPSVSHGGLNHTIASGEKLLPVMTTCALKKSFGGLFGLNVMAPASTKEMTAIGLFTNSVAEFEGARLGCGLTTATCRTPGTEMKLGGTKAVN